MLRKIVILGPESTGKSTLSEQLAQYYKTAWVPEYAREYIDELDSEYTQADLLQMAKGQILTEEQKVREAKNGLLFCDTDLYVIKVWSEHKYNNCHLDILRQISQRKYDLYLLTYIDIPWTDDPQREYPQPKIREYFYQIYCDIVIASGIPWADIWGNYQERLEKAVNAIENI